MKYRDYMRKFSCDYDAIRAARAADAERSIEELRSAKGCVPVAGASLYFVCPDGSVYSAKTGKLIKIHPGVKPRGYEFVGVTTDEGKRKYYMVHRLVAGAFLPNPLGLPEVNHRDGNKRRNVVGNLEWCDRLSNQLHMMELHGIAAGSSHSKCKLNPTQVREIRELEGRYRDIGAIYGVSAQTVCNVKRRSKYGDLQ